MCCVVMLLKWRGRRREKGSVKAEEKEEEGIRRYGKMSEKMEIASRGLKIAMEAPNYS